MSLLLSDSLIGVLDESSLAEEAQGEIGKVFIGDKSFNFDSFLFDWKSIKIHAIGDQDDVMWLTSKKRGPNVRVTLGEDSFNATGEIKQVGWEKLPHGGRMVLGISLIDK